MTDSSPGRTSSTTPSATTTPARRAQKLTKIHRRADHTEDFDRYRHLSACFTCLLRPRCTPTQRRIIKRWEHEDVLDRMQARLDHMPEAMGVRRQTVEHPFGTLKAWMGATHFLTRTLDKVRTEMSLHVLAYNLKRMITIFGGTADGGDQDLIASLKPQTPYQPAPRLFRQENPPSLTSYDAFFRFSTASTRPSRS